MSATNWKVALHPSQSMISVLRGDTGPPNWTPSASHPSASCNQQSAYTVTSAAEEESDNGTDTDTLSSIGHKHYELPSGTPNEQGQEIFWNYQPAKSK